MIHASRILVIAGSIRPRRICPKIAEWVAEVGRETVPALFEIADLKDWRLPMGDEPGVPAGHDYLFEHTRAWSRKISSGDAFVFVTPQYNWGYPAPPKNALDHLYREWSGKPAMIVTYGGHGGAKCADQLRHVLDGLKMKPLATMPAFKLARAHRSQRRRHRARLRIRRTRKHTAASLRRIGRRAGGQRSDGLRSALTTRAPAAPSRRSGAPASGSAPGTPPGP